jgi:hypothetical protein
VSKVEIINPLPGGMRYTSVERAQKFCSLGMATMSTDGRLLFTIGNQGPLLDKMTEEEEIARNRGGIINWNGSPKPKMFRKQCGRHMGPVGAPMRRPGEVRS